jgi:hypothetical protein
MNAGAPLDPTPSAPTLPAIYEATRAADGSNAVIRGAELSQAQAVARRRNGEDIVVCGSDTLQNDKLAHDIEAAAASGKLILYHGSHGGPLSLPHWQQKVPPPGGHSFHETPVRKARTTP